MTVASDPQTEKLVTIANQVLAAKELVEQTQAAAMAGESLLYQTIGKQMLANGKRTLILGDVEFRMYPGEDREYCCCHSSLPNWCPTPAHERAVFVRKSVPSLFLKRAKEAS